MDTSGLAGETSQYFSFPSAHPAPAHLTCMLFLKQSKFILALSLELSYPLTLSLLQVSLK